MSRPDLRVLFVQGAGVRAGAERALLARLRHLPEHGIEPTVAFLAEGPFRAEVERAGVEQVALGPAPRLWTPWRVPSAVAELKRVARERRADVIEGCGEKMSFLAGWAARLEGRGAVYNLQDAPHRGSRSTLTQLAAATGRHDAIVVPSRWMARAFDSTRGLRRPEVIRNAIVVDELPSRATEVRSEAGWLGETLVVGLFGRLVAWKGAEVLLQAASELAASHPQVRFLVCGGALYGEEPGFPERLRRLSRRLGVADRVHFTGHREDALELMLGCDVVCHCSVEPEPFGMVVLEGMLLGKPVIATRTGGPEEIIDHNRTGILVDPADGQALAAQIAGLAAAPDRRLGLGAAAQVAARRDFGSDATAGALSALYRRVAAGRSS